MCILADACFAHFTIFSASRLIFSSSSATFFSNFFCSLAEKEPKSDRNSPFPTIRFSLLFFRDTLLGEHHKQPGFRGGDGEEGRDEADDEFDGGESGGRGFVFGFGFLLGVKISSKGEKIASSIDFDFGSRSFFCGSDFPIGGGEGFPIPLDEFEESERRETEPPPDLGREPLLPCDCCLEAEKAAFSSSDSDSGARTEPPDWVLEESEADRGRTTNGGGE